MLFPGRGVERERESGEPERRREGAHAERESAERCLGRRRRRLFRC